MFGFLCESVSPTAMMCKINPSFELKSSDMSRNCLEDGMVSLPSRSSAMLKYFNITNPWVRGAYKFLRFEILDNSRFPISPS